METIIDISAVAAAAKTLTDIIIQALRLPMRFAPLIALTLAVLITLALSFARGELTAQGLIFAVVQSVFSFAGSVASTELQKAAQASKAEIAEDNSIEAIVGDQ